MGPKDFREFIWGNQRPGIFVVLFGSLARFGWRALIRVLRVGQGYCNLLSDRGLRNDSMEGRPEVQQQLSAHVKVGDWVPVSLDLTPLVRSQCGGNQLYLYDAPYNYPHAYKVSFRNLRLVGPETEQTQFDGVLYAPRALAGSTDGEAGSLKTDDGLTMVLGKNGGILKLLQGQALLGDGKGRRLAFCCAMRRRIVRL